MTTNTCAICHSPTGQKLPMRQADGEILYFHVNASECRPDVAPDTNTEARQQTADELEQPDFFAARVDDLPLFSSTAPRATVRPFAPSASAKQPKLF